MADNFFETPAEEELCVGVAYLIDWHPRNAVFACAWNKDRLGKREVKGQEDQGQEEDLDLYHLPWSGND